MIKQAGTVGYVSISGRKIAAILLILICSFALAWATRSGKGNKSNTSVKPAQPLVAHTYQAPMGGRPVSPATHNQSKAAGKAHKRTKTGKGALSNFKAHSIQSSRALHSKGAGQGANQGAGQGANPKSDATPTPTPEESPSPTPDTTLGLSATAPAPLP